MPMGVEVAGRMEHAADRRWRFPDEIPGENVEGLSPVRAWETSLGDAIRLNPIELANPAFTANPASVKAERGAHGGREPRMQDPIAGEACANIAGSVGRWVRIGGCGVHWLPDDAEGVEQDKAQYWRWVTTTLGQAEELGGEAGPEPIACEPFAYLENGDGTVTLVSYEGDAGEVNVPSTADGMPVTVIGASLFAGHIEIESVVLPGSITVIDEHAFDGCTSLAHIDLSESVERIGMLAFAKTGLTSLRVPPSVQSIGEKAFFHCKRLAAVELLPGLKIIGEMAFAYSGVRRAYVPASVVDLGFNAFDLTPAQKHVAGGTIQIDPQNRFYRFDGAGLYRADALVELIGYVSEYEVAVGTRCIQAGACKRHPSIAHVRLPEGLVEVGDDSFRSNRKLIFVDLPESLVRIGACAFVDTSVSSLRISANVTEIGENALLIQGESQVRSRSGISHIDLDERNPVFYMENGLLCERGASPDGGDACLLYVGPENVVRIPDEVTMIATMAFGGADGLDELFVHDHVRSFCHGWLSTAKSVPRVHVDFGCAVDGYTHGDFLLPSLSSRFRYPTSLFGSQDGKTYFDFDYYDSWVTCTTDIDEFAPAAFERLVHPMGMTERTRGLYERIFARKSARICRYFAEHGQIDALEMLVGEGLLDRSDIDLELDVAMRDGRGQATACLLEMKHRMEPAATDGIDFSL